MTQSILTVSFGTGMSALSWLVHVMNWEPSSLIVSFIFRTQSRAEISGSLILRYQISPPSAVFSTLRRSSNMPVFSGGGYFQKLSTSNGSMSLNLQSTLIVSQPFPRLFWWTVLWNPSYAKSFSLVSTFFFHGLDLMSSLIIAVKLSHVNSEPV